MRPAVSDLARNGASGTGSAARSLTTALGDVGVRPPSPAWLGRPTRLTVQASTLHGLRAKVEPPDSGCARPTITQ